MPSVLIISPHFPPATLAGVHRARHLAKYLPSFGWTPIIIRADESCYTEPCDPQLAELVPRSVEQVRTKAIPAKFARMFGIGDIGLRAYLPIKGAIKRAVAEYGPRVVFITGSPYYPMLLSKWVRKTFDLPVVLDFQDPWVSRAGFSEPLFSKRGASHLLALNLEPKVLRQASYVTSVSEVQNQQLLERYSWLSANNMKAIAIGADPADFDALRKGVDISRTSENERFLFRYVGTITPRFVPLLELFCAAIKEMANQHPGIADNIEFEFIGTSNQPGTYSAYQVMPIAKQFGIEQFVKEKPARVPYMEALRLTATANALLFVGSDESHYTASRIYSGLMANRPYVSFFHELSSAHHVLAAAKGGVSVPYSTEGEKTPTIEALCDAIMTIYNKASAISGVDPASYERFTAENIAGEFAGIFDKLAK